jgi:HEAT repeats
MRLVHLARASAERAIRKGGLRGAKASVATSPTGGIVLARAVYAMPVVADFWTTFQWLRELRRGHDEQLVAVYFRVPDSESVHCGRYNEPHVVRTAAAAAVWVLKNPAGAQVVVPRSVAPKDITGIKRVKQLVGWTEVPEPSKKFACVCSACLPHGDRHLMRRVRGAFAAGLAAARRAGSDAELLAALGTLELPLERGRDRLEHTKLVGFSRAPSPQVRRAAARLLGYFGFSKVQGHLENLLDDPHLDVRREAVESLVRAGGPVRASKLLATRSSEAISYLVELLEFEANDSVALETLERFASHPDKEVRETVQRTALALRPDFRGPATAARRLERLAAGT